MKTTDIAEALALLVQFEVIIRSRGFAGLHRILSAYKVSTADGRPANVDDAVEALDFATALYPKRVLCLQRSAVLLKLLRKRGVPARMSIGAQKLPFKAHAWIEVDGAVVGDRTVSKEQYLVLEVC